MSIYAVKTNDEIRRQFVIDHRMQEGRFSRFATVYAYRIAYFVVGIFSCRFKWYNNDCIIRDLIRAARKESDRDEAVNDLFKSVYLACSDDQIKKYEKEEFALAMKIRVGNLPEMVEGTLAQVNYLDDGDRKKVLKKMWSADNVHLIDWIKSGSVGSDHFLELVGADDSERIEKVRGSLPFEVIDSAVKKMFVDKRGSPEHKEWLIKMVDDYPDRAIEVYNNFSDTWKKSADRLEMLKELCLNEQVDHMLVFEEVKRIWDELDKENSDLINALIDFLKVYDFTDGDKEQLLIKIALSLPDAMEVQWYDENYEKLQHLEKGKFTDSERIELLKALNRFNDFDVRAARKAEVLLQKSVTGSSNSGGVTVSQDFIEDDVCAKIFFKCYQLIQEEMLPLQRYRLTQQQVETVNNVLQGKA
ncbi:MAG: hypothetical protein H7A37_03340 [Chlamydiales bacterium]|nr:hypothetical protein [Chlamydiia bacterium]MCP5507321.1 hypothetical protein [Chlamydiales bacterium]